MLLSLSTTTHQDGQNVVDVVHLEALDLSLPLTLQVLGLRPKFSITSENHTLLSVDNMIERTLGVELFTSLLGFDLSQNLSHTEAVFLNNPLRDSITGMMNARVEPRFSDLIGIIGSVERQDVEMPHAPRENKSLKRQEGILKLFPWNQLELTATSWQGWRPLSRAKSFGS